MSAESNQSSGDSSSLHPSTISQQSTQTLSSQEEDAEGEEESSKEESPISEEEEYLEEDEYLEEEKCLKGKEYLYEQEYLKEKKDLQQEKSLKEKNYLSEEEYLERGKYTEEGLPKKWSPKHMTGPFPTLKQLPKQAWDRESSLGCGIQWVLLVLSPLQMEQGAGVGPALTSHGPFLGICIISLGPNGHLLDRPSTSFMKDNRESLSWQDQGTQTECSMRPRAISFPNYRPIPQGDGPYQDNDVDNAMKSVSQRNFWGDILNEPIDTLEVEDFNDNLFKSSYHSVFRTMIKARAARNELEEDIDIPLTGHLESETRRKLGILLKTNFEDYKGKIQWIMKKREDLLNPKTPETHTYSLCLWNQSLQIEESEIEEGKKSHRVVHHKKKLEVDTEWIKNIVEVNDDVKLILYPIESIFQILFPDGSGQIHYPSGNLAMLILSTKESKFTYIILEDSEETCIRALINSSGHATFYDENREIWLSLSQNLGYHFAKGKAQKAWNWWNLNLHVHAPPVQPISLNINQYIKVQIRSQDKIIFHFIHQTKHICLNLGTKYKFILPEMLNEMKKQATLEVEFGSTAQKIQILLGKMSRILNFLTICDLENFLEGTKILPNIEVTTFLPTLDPADAMSLSGKSYTPGPGSCHTLPGLL
ncbi:glutamate-rich protein 6B [Pteronotus mesoamericanus]|uniref:glutamate-rich protein 6B n=1 Tax=Pteronotus mesoamericanus TaxID=1884717 RepID=UPI0023ED5482|nr:glutamate-rich protein 6B [Pteronotus parnellii mesoamericanus]